MADDKKAPAPEVSAPAASSSQKSPIVTLLLALNLVVMGAVAYLQYQSFLKASTEPSINDVIKAEMKTALAEKDKAENKDGKDTPPAEGQLFPLEGFTANLAQGDGPRRFVRLNAVLKFSADSKEAEFKARKPQIRDTIISILNAKRPEDLLKKEGKSYLKEEIKAAINSFLIDGKIDDIYYVGFQIN